MTDNPYEALRPSLEPYLGPGMRIRACLPNGAYVETLSASGLPSYDLIPWPRGEDTRRRSMFLEPPPQQTAVHVIDTARDTSYLGLILWTPLGVDGAVRNVEVWVPGRMYTEIIWAKERNWAWTPASPEDTVRLIEWKKEQDATIRARREAERQKEGA